MQGYSIGIHKKYSTYSVYVLSCKFDVNIVHAGAMCGSENSKQSSEGQWTKIFPLPPSSLATCLRQIWKFQYLPCMPRRQWQWNPDKQPLVWPMRSINLPLINPWVFQLRLAHLPYLSTQTQRGKCQISVHCMSSFHPAPSSHITQSCSLYHHLINN